MSEDQRGSFMARVSGFPIAVTADDQFNSQERESIEATVREWNKAGQGFAGTDIFTLRFGAIPSRLRTVDPHQCGSELGGERDFYIVREQNQTHWNSIGFMESTPGATIRCYSGEGDQASLNRQIIYMNPSLMDSGQFDEAFAHELGHSLGLDHSCFSRGRDGQANQDPAHFLSCSALTGNTSHPYFQAVMYPMLKTYTNYYRYNGRSHYSSYSVNSNTNSRVSSALQSNDHVRGQCVVGSTD